ncbi:MAG: methylated-DNA--[protein]-cysteine S-methyltransferase [Thermoguttaceae bacterium]
MKPKTKAYVGRYLSPLGNIFLLADENGLKGLWFEFQKDSVKAVSASHILAEEPFEETQRWLDIYFERRQPDFTPRFHLNVSQTRECVYREIIKQPYGKTASYEEIVDRVAKSLNVNSPPQSVGCAIHCNPLALIIPCHRIVGTKRFHNGYAGEIEIKVKLLQMEGVDLSNFSVPTRDYNLFLETQTLLTIR